MELTVFEDVKAQTAHPWERSFEELADYLFDPQEYPAKSFCPLMSGVSFGDQRTNKGSLRSDDNAVSMYWAIGDVDTHDIAVVDAQAMLNYAGIKAIIYTSASHTKEHPRWRIMAPLSADYPPSAYREFVGRVNAALGGILARESFTLSQSYYFGRVTGAAYECVVSEGQCVDLVQIEPQYPAPVATKPFQVASSAVSDEVIEELRSALAAIPSDDRPIWIEVGQALRPLGDTGRELWEEWSAKSDKYNPERDARTWEGLSGDRTDYRAIFAKAQRLGWENPRKTVPVDLIKAFGNIDIPTMNPFNLSRYKLLSGDDLAKMPPMAWVVRGILPAEGLGAIYGPSGSGKSFLILDIIAAVAGGSEWFGNRVTKTAATYVCLKGEAGLSKRVKAWSTHNKTPLPASVMFVTQQFDLLTDDVDALAGAIIENGGGGLTVIDTLNRAAPGADENSSVDMGRIIAAAKRLQTSVGGLVLLVHHTGKDTTKGLRGHSSLYAALDAAIEVTNGNGGRSWSVAKSKDDITGTAHPFDLKIIRVGFDDEGDEITSCVIESRDSNYGRIAPPKSGNQKIIFDALLAIFNNPETIRESMFTGPLKLNLDDAIAQTKGALVCEQKRQTERAQSAISGLVAKGLLKFHDGQLWLVQSTFPPVPVFPPP